jgi:crotonobetainyl-CoA:carnitine CoA-transferase CaiB-like acyl-CoA transferase
MPGPLEGIKILDFTWALAGPYGVMQLCDLGATVWKIEVVGQTEDKRAAGPIVDGINTYTFSINRGKDSILLDLKSAQGKEIALQLAEKADVVIENFSAGTMKGLGLDYDAISARNPAIVYASLSGFGQTGPYANRGAVDVIVQGLGGVMSITGYPDGPPARVGYSIGDMAGGLFMAQGVLAALVERGRSGKGQYIDVAMLDAQVNLAENAVVRHFATGELPSRIGTRHPLNTPFQALPTKDGYVVLAGVRDWALFCALIGHDELIADARFAASRDRTRHHAELEPILFDAFRQKTNDEWLAILGDKFLIAPLNTIADMGRDPQVNHREMLVDLPSWKGRSFRVVNSPVKLSRTPVKLTRGTDRPGGHTRAILKDVLGKPDDEVERLFAEGVVSESWE